MVSSKGVTKSGSKNSKGKLNSKANYATAETAAAEEEAEYAENEDIGDTKKENSNQTGSGNAGLRLLDALFDDVAYARYLLHSKLPQDALIKHKINWKDQQTGVSLLHMLVYSDLIAPVKLLLDHGANPNICNKVCFSPELSQQAFALLRCFFLTIYSTMKLHCTGVLDKTA